MKLQSMAVIFAIIIIPMALILSAYIGIQIDTAVLQQNYDTKLLDATHDSVVAFQLNSLGNDKSTNADSLRRDIKASINALFISLATNIGTPAASTTYITSYIPAVLFTLYDGYYIYSPIETEYTATDGNIKTKYEHTLKPYIPYSVRYKNSSGSCDIVVNYSLDNYISIYGYMNGEYISRSGFLVIDEDNISDDGSINNKGIEITDESAKKYYKEAKKFTKWVKTQLFSGSRIIDIAIPKNAIDEKGNKYKDFENNDIKILNINSNNDPEDELSDFNGHKIEIMKHSIQTSLNNAIYAYNEHAIVTYDFSMPVLTENDWEKLLSNINVVTFMQGIPVGTKLYNNYSIVTNTKNKQYVDKNLLYFVAEGDNYHHKINCPILIEEAKNGANITGYKNIDYDPKKDDNGNYRYDHNELACYKCVVESINEENTEIDNSLKKAYYNTIARERYNLIKTTELLEQENK